MAEVVLIPTGALEHAGLAAALGQLFLGHSFLVRPVESPLSGFTSNDLAHVPVGSPVLRRLEELVAELIAAVAPGRAGTPADFACVLEDLELVNDHQPDRVVQVFRDAVSRYLNDFPWPSARKRAEAHARLRERCSFHLFRPMTEAYFFGEPEALGRAGAVLAPQLPADLDLEVFRTTDAAYLQLPPDTRPKKQRRIVSMPHRVRHPKSYLHYLCDPTIVDRARMYRETAGGVEALRVLDWQRVVAAPPHCPFLHAFLDDLSFALNHPLAFVDQAHADQHTRFKGASTGVLRNA